MTKKNFFSSPEFIQIKEAILEDEPPCSNCSNKATNIFFLYYSSRNMSGESVDGVIPVCSTCHKKCSKVTAVAGKKRGRKRKR